MDIIMITPAPPRSLSGNRATAQRWAGFLRAQGHRVTVRVDYQGQPCDLLIALHAWRSADAAALYRERYPQHPLVVALTGTDLYRFIQSHPRPTLHSIAIADRLVVLHELAHRVIPETAWPKVRVIYQSALPLARRLEPAKRTFDVCVVGHLRDEKDSLRTAEAVRNLPAGSRIRVRHYGKAHNDEWAARATAEMQSNGRYHWFGERPHWQVRRAYGRCRLMVLSSVMEGGANVISEATVAGLPVIASDIPGSIGLLGADYPGYYPVGDSAALRECLLRAEADPVFLDQLRRHGDERARLFTPEREAQGWADLLAELEL